MQNFAKLSSSSTSSPLYDGSHYSDSTLTSGKLRFLLNYYHATIAPTVGPTVRGERCMTPG